MEVGITQERRQPKHIINCTNSLQISKYQQIKKFELKSKRKKTKENK